MPEEIGSAVRGSSRGRVLSLGAVRLHHDHVSAGQPQIRGCGLCSEGLGGALVTAQAPRKVVEVAEGDRSDQSGDAASPRGGGPGDGRGEVSWPPD